MAALHFSATGVPLLVKMRTPSAAWAAKMSCGSRPVLSCRDCDSFRSWSVIPASFRVRCSSKFSPLSLMRFKIVTPGSRLASRSLDKLSSCLFESLDREYGICIQMHSAVHCRDTKGFNCFGLDLWPKRFTMLSKSSRSMTPSATATSNGFATQRACWHFWINRPNKKPSDTRKSGFTTIDVCWFVSLTRVEVDGFWVSVSTA